MRDWTDEEIQRARESVAKYKFNAKLESIVMPSKPPMHRPHGDTGFNAETPRGQFCDYGKIYIDSEGCFDPKTGSDRHGGA